MTDPTDTTDDSTTTVVGNGLKVALIAGGILGAGFLFWRLAYGSNDEEKETNESAPASAAAVAPIASCSCGGHGLPVATPLDTSTMVRVGDRLLTIGQLQQELARRVAA